jgi:site-specific recombinase XerD
MGATKSSLRDDYARVYESYCSFYQDRVSTQAYSTLRKNSMMVLRWFQVEKISLEKASFKECIRYRNKLCSGVKKDGTLLSIGTIHNRLKAGKSIFRFIVDQGIRNTNPFDEVKYPRLPEHYSRNVLNEAQMGNLLNYFRNFNNGKNVKDRFKRYKIHVLMELLYASGLRIAEAANLVPENIDTSQRLIYVSEGKGKKSRIAFLTRYAAEVLKVYLTCCREKVSGNYERSWGHTVFGNHPERLMSLVNEELKQSCRELGLPVITSHGFRHSLGTHLHRSGCDMRYIQAILGHESLVTTQIYTEVNKDELEKVLDQYHKR